MNVGRLQMVCFSARFIPSRVSVLIFFCVLSFAFSQSTTSFEEELLQMGGDDLLFDDTPQKPVVDSSLRVSRDSLSSTDTTDVVAGEVPIDDSSTSQEEVVATSSSQNHDDLDDDTTNVLPALTVFDTAVVAYESSVDFSRNIEEYRAPHKAMLYSLLIPGWGQAYNKRYGKMALFGALEIGAIVSAVYFNKKSENTRVAAEAFADKRFSRGNLKTFFTDLDGYARKTYPSDSLIGDQIFVGVFSDNTDNATYAYNDYLAAFDADKYGAEYGVGSWYAVQGWIDAKPGYLVDNPKFYDGTYPIDTTTQLHLLIDGQRAFGISSDQRVYHAELDKVQQQGRIGSAFIVGIVVNHVASAVDAFLTAIVHNKKLLRETTGEDVLEEEFLSRLSIDNGMYYTEESGVTTKVGITWRF